MELAANAARLKTKDWPYAAIEVYLGRRSPEEMRALAAKPAEICEGAFYAGEWHLIRGNPREARTVLQSALDTCPKDFIEYGGAAAEFKRIGP